MPATITNKVFFGLLSLILAFYFVLISNLILYNTYKSTADFLITYNQIFNNHKSEILSVNHIDTIDRTRGQAMNCTNTIGQTRGRAMIRTNTIGQTTPQVANCTKTNLISEAIF